MCHLGEQTALASLANSQNIFCRAPTQEEQVVAIEVTSGFVQSGSSAVFYKYVDNQIYSVEPTLGPIEGGTLLTIRVSNLIEQNVSGM